MDHDAAPGYGLWSLVIINSLVFIVFALSFARPRTARDWRSFTCSCSRGLLAPTSSGCSTPA